MKQLAEFDGAAMIAALDEKRMANGLDWNGLAEALYGQSADLNARLGGNHLCPGALGRTAKRGTMSCQYALIILRWIGRPPEDFLSGPAVDVGPTQLPEAGPDSRLRWDLGELYAQLNAHRQARGTTWAALADEIGCTPSRVTNLRTARLADMNHTMRLTQFLQRPAAAFIAPADW